MLLWYYVINLQNDIASYATRPPSTKDICLTGFNISAFSVDSDSLFLTNFLLLRTNVEVALQGITLCRLRLELFLRRRSIRILLSNLHTFHEQLEVAFLDDTPGSFFMTSCEVVSYSIQEPVSCLLGKVNNFAAH